MRRSEAEGKQTESCPAETQRTPEGEPEEEGGAGRERGREGEREREREREREGFGVFLPRGGIIPSLLVVAG